MISIGPHTLRNSVALAPMAGITDAPFRELAWQLGAGYLVGEMTGSRPELQNSQKTRLRRKAITGALHSVQIAGSEVDWIASAARDAVADGAQVVDINFGCPAKKVCKKAAGSALMADPERLVSLASAAVAALAGTGVPVTAKMRTGPTPDDRNAPEIARRLEAAGVSALAVHGRTRACKFVGAVEYDTIAQVRRAVQIPLFVNGDITTPEEARAALAATGADGVMVGRAALGAPWVPGWIAANLAGEPTAPPPLQERLHLLLAQVRSTHRFYGEAQGVRIARKHIQWCLQHDTLEPQPHLAALSRALVRSPCAASQLELLERAATAGVCAETRDRLAMQAA